MTDFTFTADSITCNGKTFPAGYSVTPSGSVMVFVTVEGAAERTRIRFKPDDPNHAAALAAATGKPAPIEHPTEERRETVPAAPAEAPTNSKAARGPVPEKPFIGQSIQGQGWRIFFDGEASRTRVIFDGKPSAAARTAVEKAGFYFSSAMNSWNKKLTFKAYRAAQALSGELHTLCA